jgi:hypothetical protein
MMILVGSPDIPDKKCVGMFQIHSSKVAVVSKNQLGTDINDCDGLVTNDPNIYLKISVADCIPLTLFDPQNKCIGLVHAGWRGLYGGIITNAIHTMSENFGTDPADIVAEIGPHICEKHYEIKDDLAEKFSGFPSAVRNADGRMFLDLAKVAEIQLSACGVLADNIKGDRRCTFEDKSLPSYRRGDLKKCIHYYLKVS